MTLADTTADLAAWAASQNTFSRAAMYAQVPGVDGSTWPQFMVEAMFNRAPHLVDGLLPNWRASVAMACPYSDEQTIVAAKALLELLPHLDAQFETSGVPSSCTLGDPKWCEPATVPVWPMFKASVASIVTPDADPEFCWPNGDPVGPDEMEDWLPLDGASEPWKSMFETVSHIGSCCTDLWVADAIAVCCVLLDSGVNAVSPLFFDTLFADMVKAAAENPI